MCGFAHWSSFTVPVSSTTFVSSNIAAEWCATTGADARSAVAINTAAVEILNAVMMTPGG